MISKHTKDNFKELKRKIKWWMEYHNTIVAWIKVILILLILIGVNYG